MSAERRRWPAALRALEDSSGGLSPDSKWPFVDCSATHFPALPLRCGSSSVAPVVRYATHNLNERCWVARRQRSYYRFPAINATGRPALGRRRSRLRTRKAACFALAAWDDSRLAVLIEPARRFGQPRLSNPQRGSVLVLNTEHPTSEHFLVRYPWPTLRRRYGPVLATLASSLTDFHVRRSDAIRAPGLAWAATSMIAAGYQSISSCQSQRLPALQAGKARHQVGPMFRRDSSGLASVESFARRFVIRLKTENQV